MLNASLQVTKANKKINFFTIPEFEEWLETCPDPKKWDKKYYKVCYSWLHARLHQIGLTPPILGSGNEQGHGRSRLLQ